MSRWADVMVPSYGEPALTLVRGDGATVWDADGNEYVDLVAGIAVNALGHAHPAVVEAVTRQVATLGHTSNLVANEPSLQLAERLLALTGRDGRVFFASSGAEANEAAFKMSRRTGRSALVAAEGGFHGRTMGALALTGQPAKRAPFEPLPTSVDFVPYGDVAALRAAVGPQTAAVVLEPVLGEGGVVPAPAGYLEAAREVTRDAGALLVLDEVQAGIGRTGAWFAHQTAGVEPDVVTLAKGLGGRSARAWPSATRRRCCSRGSTARPSAATRSRARPRSQCSTRSRPTGCCSAPRRSARLWLPASTAWDTRSSRRSEAWVSCSASF
jgi:acetylornithine/N-succinyldiaminopimelate aminotransferase